jgi:hypothetical protein
MTARLALLSAAFVAAFGGDAVAAGGVSVPMDNVTLVSFKTPVSVVYVGNSSIAEVTMIDTRHAFVLGKRFGATNLIALGSDRSVITDEAVFVSSRHGGAITVFRGPESYNYSCTDFHCETRPMPGDPKTWFDNTESTAVEHEEAGTKAAGGATVSQTH